MTLNITIISAASIHQSADFQISRTERDSAGDWVGLQQNSSKIVSLRYQAWSGFLTYCGVGLWKGKRTDEYCADWLAELGPHATFNDAVEKVRERGTAWIQSIAASVGETQAHSFAIAGYENGVPRYAIISNHQTWTQSRRPLSVELLVDSRRSTSGVHVFVTGIRGAVPQAAIRKLKHLVRAGAASNVVRHEMAAANRSAAQSLQSRKGISQTCLVYSVDKHGGGAGEIHGEVPGPVMPKGIFGGAEITKLLAPLLSGNPNAKLVQTAFATTRSSTAAGQEHIDCKLRIGSYEHTPNERELASLQEVGDLNEYCLSMHAINTRGEIVGQLRRPVQAFPHAFVWFGEEIKDLGTFGGPFSNALCVNDNGQVAGSAHADHAASCAFVWDRHRGMVNLGTLGGRDSVARSINGKGHVVGDSFANVGEPKHEDQRAFLWLPDEGMINLGAELGGWSRAVSINSHDTVLSWSLHRGVACAVVWSSESGPIRIVGEQGRAFFPCAVNDSGLVVGEGDDTSGKRRTFVWTRENGLRKLAAPDDFHPCDLDSVGNILGNVHSRPWSRPYIYSSATGQFLGLPFVEEHHTSVKAINRLGVIVGSAWTSSWKHSHPLIWRLNALDSTRTS